LDEQIEKAEKERVKSEKMYRTLGMIIGFAIVIILM
jgi:stage III sporulation protein AB